MNRWKVASVHNLTPLVVVSDFRIEDIADFPTETYPPLIVDPDTPLTSPVAVELFQPVAGRNPDEVKCGSGVQLLEFALGNALDILRQPCGKPAMKKFFGLFAGKGSDHGAIVSHHVSVVKR